MSGIKSCGRRVYDDGFKVKVVLEALREVMLLSEFASKYAVHPNQIAQWKSKFLEKAPDVFSRKTADRQGKWNVCGMRSRVGAGSKKYFFEKKVA